MNLIELRREMDRIDGQARRLISALLRHHGRSSPPEEPISFEVTQCACTIEAHFVVKGFFWTEWQLYSSRRRKWSVYTTTHQSMMGSDLRGDKAAFERDAVLFILSAPEP